MFPFVVTNSHFKSCDYFRWFMKKAVFTAFRKCTVYRVSDVKVIVKLVMTLKNYRIFGLSLSGLGRTTLKIACEQQPS